jgi:hypothetical protein
MPMIVEKLSVGILNYLSAAEKGNGMQKKRVKNAPKYLLLWRC